MNLVKISVGRLLRRGFFRSWPAVSSWRSVGRKLSALRPGLWAARLATAWPSSRRSDHLRPGRFRRWLHSASGLAFGYLALVQGGIGRARPLPRSGRACGAAPFWSALGRPPGVAIFIIGVTLVKGYETERDLRMAPGEKVVIGGYEFTFKGTRAVEGPNYAATRGDFEVRREGSAALVRTMHPEKRVYHAAGQTMTEADIDTGITRDIYVSLGDPVGDGAWGVRVYHKPFVDWIWAAAS